MTEEKKMGIEEAAKIAPVAASAVAAPAAPVVAVAAFADVKPAVEKVAETVDKK